MSNQTKKFYAVRNGREPGIYRTWAECKEQVDGYANAQYKGFSSLEDARAYLGYAATGKPDADKKTTKSGSSDDEARARQILKTSDGLKHVVIYTDGACLGNPGRGGYGVVLLHDDKRKEFSHGFRLTTNNRMEILACIVGLQALKGPCAVTLYSDSQYVINSMSKGWARRWQKNNWKRKDQKVPNADLWQKMLELCDEHEVKFNWVRGHAGNKENERCDQLARQSALGSELAIDSIYENNL